MSTKTVKRRLSTAVVYDDPDRFASSTHSYIAFRSGTITAIETGVLPTALEVRKKRGRTWRRVALPYSLQVDESVRVVFLSEVPTVDVVIEQRSRKADRVAVVKQ